MNTENQTAPAVNPANTPAKIAEHGALNAFQSSSTFEAAQRMAVALAKSTIVPKDYQNNVPNCIVALEMANRIGVSPMMVMQNMVPIHGKPSWSSTFIISGINTCGRFSQPLQFKVTGEGDNRTCIAFTFDKNGNFVEGTPVSIAMAKAEGWFNKTGSKWKTMPEQMLRYRAAAFFGRLHAPELTMGMHTIDEISDMQPAAENKEAVNAQIMGSISRAQNAEPANEPEPAVVIEPQPEPANEDPII